MMRLAWTLLLVSTLGFAASAVAQGQPAPAGENPPPGDAAAPPPSSEPPPKPTKLFVGGGLGGGLNAKATINGKSSSFDDRLQGTTDKSPLIAVNLVSLGIGLNPNLYAGLDVSAVAQSGKLAVSGDTLHLQITNYLGALTYFPWETGLFLRAGLGISVFSTITPSQSQRSSGLGALLGLGFAQQLSGPHHLTLLAEQTWQSYSGTDSTKPKSSQAGAIFLGYMYKN